MTEQFSPVVNISKAAKMLRDPVVAVDELAGLLREYLQFRSLNCMEEAIFPIIQLYK